MVLCWALGLVLLVAGAVVSVVGIGWSVRLGPTVREPGDGTIELNLPTEAEARVEQRAQRRRLLAAQVGVLLATVGGVLSAFGQQPWSHG
ncbi:hypothetical protein QDR37_09135 [Amnibacterium sp. CER49]|uniref:hypothetical protein n=1 Tax=Amnibacterium sp. CER49 TaxID=3039161 RepID=UPI00244B0435|nr:hypothetical protein [Amnibacterium sp. CER49]MDH2444108.1 hypothetical protein [Amnibacterium sp. CER49]